MSKRRRRTKAANRFDGTPRGQIPTARQGASSAADRVTAMTQQTASANVGEATPMTRDPAWSIVPFAPSQPIPPSAINRPRPDTNRAEPRLAELPVGWNLPGSSHRHLPWFILREAADRITLFRRCIQIRKEHMQGLDWGFRISPGAVEAAGLASGGTPRAKLQRDLHNEMAGDIERAKKFWAVPDRGQDYEFSEWLGLLLEEVYVLDALAIYPRLTYGGDLDSLEILDGTCYSADTEVLTEDGWKTFDRVDLATDLFATRNQKTHAFEWQQATYFHEADWDSARDGQCYSVASRSLDLLVTPNHRMLVTSLPRALGGSRHAERGEHFVRAEDLFAHGSHAQAIPAMSTWDAADITSFDLAATGRTTSLPFSCTGDQFAAFMGMWLAEGCAPSGDQVMISQMPESKGFEPYRALLAEIFGREVCHTGRNFVVGRKCLHDYLAQFGHAVDKFVPALLKNASRRQLEIFWRFYMLGDGHYAADGRESITTVSRRMADDLQEIAQKIGYSASISSHQSTRDTTMSDGRVIFAKNKRRKYTIRLRTSSDQRYRMAPVDYVGKVYCVSVPNETLYVRRNGKPAWCGNTIKPLRDERGGRPRPPLPAYQQILWGFPRGEFQATVDEAGLVPGAMAADDLIYKRRTIRTHTPYGYSPVEQALDDGDLYLKRHAWLKAEYTVGAMPQGMFEVNPDSGLNPHQVAELERFYNDLLSGNTEERMKARFLPPGITPSERADIGEKYKPEYDLHLMKTVIAHFDTVLPELGFSEAKGLGSSGYHEGQEDVQQRKTLPIIKDVQGLVTRLTHRYLKIRPEIEFFFLGLDDEDEAAADELEAARFADGVITLNDRRDRLGLERYPFAEADMPLIKLTRGILFLEGASEGVPPGAAIEPGKALQEGGASPPVDEQAEQDEDPDGTDQAPATKPGEDPKAAEKKAYARWVRKGRSRAFEWHHHDADEVAELTKAGGGAGKAAARLWPGWAKDRAAAEYWAEKLSRAMRGVAKIRDLARRWLGLSGSPVDVGYARAWLDSQGLDFEVLTQILTGVWTDGYLVGSQAAASVVAGTKTDWGDWTPGDIEAANEVLGEQGGMGLQAMLDQVGVTIRSIEAHRLDALAQALADALENGDSIDTLAATLRGVLDNPQWAYLVAQTETTRAVSIATQNIYRRNGIEANYWATAADQRVCPVCDGNAADGAVPVGQSFESGDTAPPAHPACRCALMPDVVSPDELL